MRTRSVLLILVAIVMIPALSFAAAARHHVAPRITVKPTSGSPTTRFLVSFRTPDRTGRVGIFDRRDELSLQGPSHAAGCILSVSKTLPAAAAHARVAATLDAEQLGGKWCVGAYRGQIEEIQGPACVTAKPCPEFASLLRRLGTFAFRVKSVRPEDTTPPAFAGVQSAFACTPGPQRPGQTTPFTLKWAAATDDVTPSSQIVYDLFMSTTPGGEDLSHATWTTPPGVTQFKTPGLASHGTFYFVVRARDQAGNEDQNRVERRGIDPCV
jgi:hypothetical protein